MPNYTAPSSRLALAALLAASSCALLGCSLFEPESHFECFNPDCSTDSGISDASAGTSDAGRDDGASGSSGSDSGGASGMGADAGSACMACDSDLVCNELDGKCVQCLGNADCESSAAVCTVDHRCVACTLDRHCPSTAPACNADNMCVGCTDSALHCSGKTPLCDITSHECVQCLENSDCTDPAAARCSDGTCQPCTGPLHCDHLDGLGVCDTTSGTGECVQCTGTVYDACGTADAGKPYVCDSKAKACTTKQAGSALACESCVSDAQCRPGTACMQTKFGDAETGYFCLWKQDATGTGAPNGDCLTARPFIGTESTWKSIDGEDPTVCRPRTSTCQAQSDFSAKECSGTTPEGNAECGAEGVNDAYCAPFGGGFYCTVPCVSYLDCKDTRPSDDMECQQQTLGTVDVNVCQFE